MTENEPLSLKSQIDALIRHAKMIHEEPFKQYQGELSQGQMKLRPSVKSFSLVSYADETPQLGRSNLNSAAVLGRRLKKLSLDPLKPPGRPTPEKKLQSWLIRESVKNHGMVRPLNDVLGGEYWFVSDEIALNIGPGIKVVADLLLVKVDAEGLAHLVNVELKSKRDMDTFRQVVSFRNHALEQDDLRKSWQDFCDEMIKQTFRKQTFRWSKSRNTQGIVVWPKNKNPENTRVNGMIKNAERIDLVRYQETDGYTLWNGSPSQADGASGP